MLLERKLRGSARRDRVIETSVGLSAGTFTGEWLLTWGNSLSDNNVFHVIGLLVQVIIYVWMLILIDKMIAYPISHAKRIAGYVGVVAGATGLYMSVMLFRYVIYVQYPSEFTRLHTEDAMSVAITAFTIGVPAIIMGVSCSLYAGKDRTQPGIMLNAAALVIGLLSYIQ